MLFILKNSHVNLHLEIMIENNNNDNRKKYNNNNNSNNKKNGREIR